MKVLRLDLRAFGPFTGAVLSLEAGDHGLHVIYGPNEAGKSSALRAVEQLLFGIDERTTDDFVHPKEKLRIGAKLRAGDGSELEFVRRKGRKNTLHEADEKKPFDPAGLAKLLGSLSPELFRTMFGLTRATLEEGAKEILLGGGEVGQLLFAAGTGIADLRRVRDRIQGQYETLFLPRGQKQAINTHLSEWSEQRSEMKSHLLACEVWQQHDRALGDSCRRRDRLQADVDQLDAQLKRLTRLRDAQPMLVRREGLLRELEQCRDAVLLPVDFSARRLDALTALSNARARRASAVEALGRLADELERITVPEELLAQAEDIERLLQEKGSIDKAQLDRGPNLRSQLGHEHRARELWKSLGHAAELSDGIESLRLTPNEPENIRRHGQQFERIQAERQNIQATIEKARQKTDDCDQALAALPQDRDVGELRRLVARIQKLGPLENGLAKVEQQLARTVKQADQVRQQLRLRAGPLDGLLQATFPSHETVERFDQEFRDIKQLLDVVGNERTAAENQIDRLESELRQLDLAHDLPTDEELRAARKRRDDIWQRLRESLKHVQTLPDSELIENYEASVFDADAMVDRLRREAERVAKKAESIAQQNRLRAELLRAAERERAQLQRRAALDAAWHIQWQPLGLEPLSPSEMRPSVARFEELLQTIRQTQLQEEEVSAQRRQIEARSAELLDALNTFGPRCNGVMALAELLEAGHSVLGEQDQLAAQRKQLGIERANADKELRQAESASRKADESLAAWNDAWAVFMTRLGQPLTTSPADASQRLQAIQQLWVEWDHAKILRSRIEGIDRDKKDFDRRVAALRDRFLPGNDHASTFAVVDLHEELKKARLLDRQAATLRDQRSEWLEQQRRADGDVRAQQAIIETLCQQAGAESEANLPFLEERSQRRRDLERELRDRNAELAPLQAGKSLEEFAAECADLDVDRLGSEQDRLAEKKRLLTDELKLVVDIIAEEKNELKRMDGSAAAAEAAQRAEELTAQIRDEVRNYAVLRIAANVLQCSVERYRSKNEGPILQRAGELFARLTGNSFARLAVDPTENGEPVLVGVRARDGLALAVEAMSDGTRDQLYLALRLASLELYLQSHEPVPFIVDDLLLTFDDTRAVAALEALAELSRKTQVLFFTHHRHLVELASANLTADVLFVHRL